MGASSRRSIAPTASLPLLAALPFLAGCDPVWSISGAFFPAWLLCMVGGLFAAVLARSIISRVGIEPFIGPRVVVYGMLYVACTCTIWLVFFAR